MRVGQLLEASAVRKDDAYQVKLKIAALLAKDAEQQRKIYRLFDAYLERQSIHTPKEKVAKPAAPLFGKWWHKNAMPLILLLIGSLLMAGTSYWYADKYLGSVDATSYHPYINHKSGVV